MNTFSPGSDLDPHTLDEHARELLLQATKSREGVVIVLRSHQGTTLSANGHQFIEQGNPRSEARWQAAVHELQVRGFLKDPNGKGELFRVTDAGYIRRVHPELDGLRATRGSAEQIGPSPGCNRAD